MPMFENDARRAAMRRVRDDTFLARLMAPYRHPGNRAERREYARLERCGRKAARRKLLEKTRKQIVRAWRKARRAARQPLGA